MWIATLLVGLTILALSTADLASYQEKCAVGHTPDGKEMDTCDKQKFLKCRDDRCQCADPKNQIWTSGMVKENSRSKRSKDGKKRGFGKGVAVGAVGGVAGGLLAAHAVNSMSGGGNNAGGASSGDSSSSSKHKGKHVKIMSCYSRVEGSCMLPNVHGSNVVVSISKREEPDSTLDPVGITGAAANLTSLTEAAHTSHVTYDVLSLPQCVDNAECKQAEVKIVDGKVVSGGSGGDPRIGACRCMTGYKPDNTDACIKDSSASRSQPTGEPSLALVMSALLSAVLVILY